MTSNSPNFGYCTFLILVITLYPFLVVCKSDLYKSDRFWKLSKFPFDSCLCSNFHSSDHVICTLILFVNKCIAFISLSTFNNKDIFHKLRGNCYEKSSLAASKYVLGIHWTSLYFWIYVQKEHILYITRHMKHNLDSLSTTCIEKKNTTTYNGFRFLRNGGK